MCCTMILTFVTRAPVLTQQSSKRQNNTPNSVAAVAASFRHCLAVEPSNANSQCMREAVRLIELLRRFDPLKVAIVGLSRFAVFKTNNLLIFRRLSCVPDDVATDNFTLNVYARNLDDLPLERQQFGFESHDFGFSRNGRFVDGQCIAVVELPTWPSKRMTTGVYLGQLTSVAWHLNKDLK